MQKEISVEEMEELLKWLEDDDYSDEYEEWLRESGQKG